MSTVISVENLSKAYRIGLKEEIPDTLTGAMTSWAKAPWRNFQRLRRLNTFRSNENGKNLHDEEDIFWALKDVSFEVKEGEVVGIIGRNGAGKSTLLKVLSRITEPTSGRAVIRGRVSSLLEVGTGFHPELTGRENIYMNGTILGMSKREIDRKFDEIVDFSGVEKFLDTPIKRYSSGMKVRLAFSVAAHLEPEILIVDEVLAVGDAEFQKKCLGKMQDAASGGRTVLFVSHNMVAVEALCKKALLLERGQITLMGEISHVVNGYLRSMSQQFPVPFQCAQPGTYLRSLQLIDHHDTRTTVYRLGATFRLRAVIHPRQPLSRPLLGVGIDDRLGTRLISVNTATVSGGIAPISRSTVIDCTIPRLPLAPGEYSVKIALNDQGRDVEVHQIALTFSVVDADVHGKPSGFHSGICYVPAYWSIQRENVDKIPSH